MPTQHMPVRSVETAIPIERRSVSGAHAYFEIVGQENREFCVVLSLRSEGREFDAVLTPLMATGLKAEIGRVLEARRPRRNVDF